MDGEYPRRELLVCMSYGGSTQDAVIYTRSAGRRGILEDNWRFFGWRIGFQGYCRVGKADATIGQVTIVWRGCDREISKTRGKELVGVFI